LRNKPPLTENWQPPERKNTIFTCRHNQTESLPPHPVSVVPNLVVSR
jgi:hypothetical protein